MSHEYWLRTATLDTQYSSLITHHYFSGEVQEWLNWQHWKCCERETVPWVRIPPSPPYDFGFRISDSNGGFENCRSC